MRYASFKGCEELICCTDQPGSHSLKDCKQDCEIICQTGELINPSTYLALGVKQAPAEAVWKRSTWAQRRT
eukprot:1158514-Pelagomonas_calceolata.AAC.14